MEFLFYSVYAMIVGVVILCACCFALVATVLITNLVKKIKR